MDRIDPSKINAIVFKQDGSVYQAKRAATADVIMRHPNTPVGTFAIYRNGNHWRWYKKQNKTREMKVFNEEDVPQVFRTKALLLIN